MAELVQSRLPVRLVLAVPCTTQLETAFATVVVVAAGLVMTIPFGTGGTLVGLTAKVQLALLLLSHVDRYD